MYEVSVYWSQSMGPQPREPKPMWPQPRDLQPNDINLYESLGIEVFVALLIFEGIKIDHFKNNNKIL